MLLGCNDEPCTNAPAPPVFTHVQAGKPWRQMLETGEMIIVNQTDRSNDIIAIERYQRGWYFRILMLQKLLMRGNQAPACVEVTPFQEMPARQRVRMMRMPEQGLDCNWIVGLHKKRCR